MSGRRKGGGRFPVEDGWTRVDRRRLKSKEGWENKMETTFFIENLPEETSNNLLWKAFGKVGRLSDAYVAKKKDVAGNKFGFLRFLNVRDVNEVLEKANEIRVLEAVVKVTLARFDRNHRKFEHKNEVPFKAQEMRRSFAPPGLGGDSSVGGQYVGGRMFRWGMGATFKDVVCNQRGGGLERRSIRLEGEGGLLQQLWIGKTVIGEGKEVDSLTGIRASLDENGFQDVGLSYVGGMKVFINFHDKKQALVFINEKRKVWDNFLESAKLWNGEELPVERVARITIRGVPIQVREDETFNKIGGMFGKVVGRSRFEWSNIDVAVGLCHVLVNRWEKIDEIVNVAWKDRNFEVKVSEEGEVWSPVFGEVGGLEEGEILQKSTEKKGDSGSRSKGLEDGEMEGEGSGLGKCMHGEKECNNGRTESVNEYNFEGFSGDFSMGSGPVSNKKRRRSGSFCDPLRRKVGQEKQAQVNRAGLENDRGQPAADKQEGNGLDKVSDETSSAMETDGNFSVENQSQGHPSSAPVVEKEAEETNTATGMETDGNNSAENQGQGFVSSSPEVEKEVEETIKVGDSIGVNLEGFRKEVEELVNGDGVLEVNQ